MSENSLFAILMRSPWWMSLLLALVVGLGARFTFPADMAGYAPFIGFPFIVTAGISLWRQWRAPSAARVATTLEAANAMGWREFRLALEEGFRAQGYAVAPHSLDGADLELTRDGSLTLVAARRWKAVNQGVDSLRELEQARSARAAGESIYVALAPLSGSAAAFARDNGIRVFGPADLARVLPAAARASKARP